LSFGDEIADPNAGTIFKEGKRCRELLLEVALGRTGIPDWTIFFNRLENASPRC
jgi:hypothetical protein